MNRNTMKKPGMKKIWNRISRLRDPKLFYIALRCKLRLGDRRKWQVIWEYYLTRRRFPNLKRPSDLSEYVYAEILYRRIDKYSLYADKVRVRDYVESKGLGGILTRLYGVWNTASEIDFGGFPERFVIKTNNACKQNIVCTDKRKPDVEAARRKLDGWQGSVFGGLDTHYAGIEPKILAEEFIDDGTGGLPSDYKFMCVNGKPFLILVCADRDMETFHPELYMFDRDWNYLPRYSADVRSDWAKIEKPRNLAEMLEYASVLSADFPFVRVDLYDTGSRVYFGELTFAPAGGSMHYFTDEALRDMYAGLAGTTI